MPGWHDSTLELQRDGLIQMIGIVQEQHPDRARLFMQWKEMPWPVLVDAQNELEVPVVPITVLIDEHGIIRRLAPRGAIEPVLRAFVETEYPAPDDPAPPARLLALEDLDRAAADGGVLEQRAYARALVDWGGPEKLTRAIKVFESADATAPNDGLTLFQLGVAYRMRYDSAYRQDDDFQRAIDAWSAALALAPNQYIWRRRIQQYGPRLEKPYPFFDWVERARAETAARGETPVALDVEPSGAEFAQPERVFRMEPLERAEPDAAGKIDRDDGRFITIETTVVPSRVAPGGTARVHVICRPRTGSTAHWNNEAAPMELWIPPPAPLDLDRRCHEVPNPGPAVSDETRAIEFEVRVPAEADPGPITVPAYALYNVCEDVDGACLYRRQDLEITVDVIGK